MPRLRRGMREGYHRRPETVDMGHRLLRVAVRHRIPNARNIKANIKSLLSDRACSVHRHSGKKVSDSWVTPLRRTCQPGCQEKPSPRHPNPDVAGLLAITPDTMITTTSHVTAVTAADRPIAHRRRHLEEGPAGTMIDDGPRIGDTKPTVYPRRGIGATPTMVGTTMSGEVAGEIGTNINVALIP